MEKSERVAVLAQAPIFYGLPEEVLARLTELTEDVAVRPGQKFITAGDIEPWMYLVVSGEARVHDGDRTIATVTAGSTVGELAVLDPAPRSADVTANEPCQLLRLDHAHLAELMMEEPELTEGIISMLVRMIRSNSDQIGPESVSAV